MAHDLEQVGRPRRVEQLSADRDPPRLVLGQAVDWPRHRAYAPRVPRRWLSGRDVRLGSRRMRDSAPRVPGELRFDATDAVRDALARMGRTGGPPIQPRTGERLAFACYSNERIALADVRDRRELRRPGRSRSRVSCTSSRSVSASRTGSTSSTTRRSSWATVAGQVEVFRLRDSGGDRGRRTGRRRIRAARLAWFRRRSRARSPAGSEVVACNNWANTVTRHPLGPRHRSESSGEVIARRWLDLPDGARHSATTAAGSR